MPGHSKTYTNNWKIELKNRKYIWINGINLHKYFLNVTKQIF